MKHSAQSTHTKEYMDYLIDSGIFEDIIFRQLAIQIIKDLPPSELVKIFKFTRSQYESYNRMVEFKAELNLKD